MSSTKKIENKIEPLLKKFSLRFSSQKLESEFMQEFKENTRQYNKWVSNLLFLISVLTISFILISNINFQKEGDVLNIKIIYSNNQTLITEIKEYGSSVGQEYLFKLEYYLLNQTKIEMNNYTQLESLLSFTYQENYNFAVSYFYLKVAFYVMSFTVIFYLLCLIFSWITKKEKHHTLLFCFITIFFGDSFHIISGTLNIHYKIGAEDMFFVLAFQLLLQVIITFKFNTCWRLFLISNLISNIIEWSYFVAFIKMNNVLLFYLIVNTLVHLICTIISYANFKKYKLDFYLQRKLNKERKNLLDFVYSMNQGFISYNENTLFINNSMKKIISHFNKDISAYFDNEERMTNFNNEIANCKGSNSNLKVNSNEDFDKKEYCNENIFKSNVRSDFKIEIKNLFKILTDLNPMLPEEILKCFYTNSEFKNNFDDFYEIVKKNENYSKFTYLGVVNSQTNIGISSNSIKKFQVSFRVNSLDSKEDILDLTFHDVSEVVQMEREKAVVNSRSLYLSKIAHEFRNPISVIMELSSCIIDDSSDKGVLDPSLIINKAGYIDKLCKVMSHFLSDYTIFTNMKFSCVNKCKIDMYNVEGELSECNHCNNKQLCRKCKICKLCEKKNETKFDLEELIKNINSTFTDLSKDEKGNDDLRFNDSISSESIITNNLIQTNKEILKSAIYNLIFYSYKSSGSGKGEINICVNRTLSSNNENILTAFEITNNILQIDQNFINYINFEKNNNNYEDNNCDLFNKNFELYVAFYMIKKLGAELEINSNKYGSKFFFKLDTNICELDEINLLKEAEDINDTIINEMPMMICYNELEELINSQFETEELNDNVKIENNNFLSINNNVALNDVNVLTDINVSFVNTVATSKNMRALIIDDESMIRKSIRRHLLNISKSADINFEVFEASNCFEAIQILSQNLNKVQFDFVIIDEYMPNMKGSTFIKLFKGLIYESNFYSFSIISHTAFDTNEKKKFILDSGADYILSKPVQINDLKEVILEFIK